MRKGKRFVWIFIALVLGLMAVYQIALKLTKECTAEAWSQLVEHLYEPKSLGFIVLALILMPVNWMLEAWKWKHACSQNISLTFYQALQSICSGLFTGFFMPGRVTEFVGKIAYVDKNYRATATAIHGLLSQIQFFITLIFGITAWLINSSQPSKTIQLFLVLAVAITLTSMGLIIKYQHLLVVKIQRFFPNQKTIPNLMLLSPAYLIPIVSCSVIRYFVFSTQFILIALACHLQVKCSELIFGLPIYFLITSAIPMISVFEPAIRTLTALYVFGGSSENTLTFGLTITLVWFINLVLPGLWGYYRFIKRSLKQ